MGTRHLICIVHEGKYKLAQYGQWDGYPESQGSKILAFLIGNDYDEEAFTKNLSLLHFVTAEEFDAFWVLAGAKSVNMDISDRFEKLYPSLHRSCGSDILSIIQTATVQIPTRDELPFAGQSLFCEWAYVIDFDRRTFEVYKGFNHTVLGPEERFHSLEFNPQVIRAKEGPYRQVKHLRSWQLDNLPSQELFLQEIDMLLPKDDEEE